MKTIARMLTAAFIVTCLGPCQASDLQITRGAHGDWKWSCAFGGKSGLSCELIPYPLNALAIRLFGLPRFKGPDIAPTLSGPPDREFMMQIDDGPRFPIKSTAPASLGIIALMSKGRTLKVDFQALFDPRVQIVDVSLAGLKPSYCDAIRYLAQHGAHPDSTREGRAEIVPLPACDEF